VGAKVVVGGSVAGTVVDSAIVVGATVDVGASVVVVGLVVVLVVVPGVVLVVLVDVVETVVGSVSFSSREQPVTSRSATTPRTTRCRNLIKDLHLAAAIVSSHPDRR
jgi:hypothetical protein